MEPNLQDKPVIPTGEYVELLSEEWRSTLSERLECFFDNMGESPNGEKVVLSLILRNAPPHLALPDNVGKLSIVVSESKIEVKPDCVGPPEFLVEADYTHALPIAQAVGEEAISRAIHEAKHNYGQACLRVEGALPEGSLRIVLRAAWDHMARRTLENPDLAMRVVQQGLTGPVAELEDLGYTVIENAISPEFTESLRKVVMEETLSHNNLMLGRVDSNGLLARGRPFEDIVQIPKLRTLAETALGSNMVLYTVGSAVSLPGPGSVPLHTDMPNIPDPYPKWGVIGVAVWAFEDWIEETGTTWVMPGSHKLRRSPGPQDTMDGGVPILMPKGSVTFFSHGIHHWQGDRSLPGPRVTLHNAYCRAFLRQADDFSHLDAALHRNSPVLSNLVGRNDHWGLSGHMGHDPSIQQTVVNLINDTVQQQSLKSLRKGYGTIKDG